jgi:hypothetical protein
LETYIPRPLDSKALAASPGAYIPALKYMLKQMEEPHKAARNGKRSDTQVLPRLFSLFPNPSLGWRFIPLNAEMLVSFFPAIEKATGPSKYHEIFWKIFDFGKFRIRR